MTKTDAPPVQALSFEQKVSNATLSHLDYCRACAPMAETLSVDGEKVVRSTTFDLCPVGRFLATLKRAGA